MNILMCIWFAVAIGSMFYVTYQVNIGKSMTKRESSFFLLGLFIMMIPMIYLLSQGG